MEKLTTAIFPELLRRDRHRPLICFNNAFRSYLILDSENMSPSIICLTYTFPAGESSYWIRVDGSLPGVSHDPNLLQI